MATPNFIHGMCSTGILRGSKDPHFKKLDKQFQIDQAKAIKAQKELKRREYANRPYS